MKILFLAMLIATTALCADRKYPDNARVKIISGPLKTKQGRVVDGWPCVLKDKIETFCYKIESDETDYTEYFVDIPESILEKL